MRSALCVVVAVAVALTGTPASGGQTPAISEYEQVQRDLARTRRLLAQAEARERSLKKSIAVAASQRHALLSEIAELTEQLQTVQRDVDSAAAELGVVNQRLTAKAEELEVMLTRLQAAHTVVRRRAVQVYKTGPASFLEFLLGATTFSDLVTRINFLSGVFANDDSRIRSYRAQRDRVQIEMQEIEALRELASSNVRLVEVQRNEVASIRGAIDQRKRSLDSQLSRQYASLADVQRDKQQYLRQQRLLEEESRRISALLRGRGGGTASAKPGEMVWPTSGPVTSGFGWRTHPIYGDRRMHEGVDIGAPSGQSIVAAAAGTVIHSGPRSGYGNSVIVDHGGGLATVYAHMSSTGVGNGGKVGQGKFIGRVGCTGSCTGPHLHFEVRVSGEPRNPMNWLS